MNKIDYSQLSKFGFCPWAWYETYVKGMSPRYVGQRSDALALGSLVHNGLDNYSKTGKPFIDDATLLEVTPTPECKLLAEVMISGYIRKYPSERWPVERTEQAVEFPLHLYDPEYLDFYKDRTPPNDWTGVAKLDGYFYVSEDTTIESGLPDQHLTLGRGWWSREYKTKSHGIDRGVWMKEWAAKRQADFQLLALESILKDEERQGDPNGAYGHTPRGVLVSILEKPREYTPKRKCKGCSGQYELASFFANPDGHVCPACGHVQKLKPYEPVRPSAPEYFRMIVTRTPEQLEVARREIAGVAERMEEYRDYNRIEVEIPNRDNCITNRWHRQCEFAEQHIAGVDVAAPTFVKIDPYKYIGL